MNCIGAATRLAVVLGFASLPLYAADPTATMRDPQSPGALGASLDEADSQATRQDGDCQSRLDKAQQQLELARSDPAIEVALPTGLARVASVEYRIHFARASCGASQQQREQELRAALEAARRAVDLYRDDFDAVSMTAMQFNAGVAYFTLGDTRAAIAALQTAIDMDREYGFEDDARDNYRLLLQWRNEEAGTEQVDALMKDFPQRTTTLSFGWSSNDATVSLEGDYAQIAGGEVLHIRDSRTAQRQIRKRFNSWAVSYQIADAHYNLGNPPDKDPFVQGFALSLSGMLLRFHDFFLSRDGTFNTSKGDLKFDARVRADARTLVQDIASTSNRAPLLARRVGSVVKDALWGDNMERLVAEDYNLEAGTWIGATLEQGVWYEMSAPLSWQIAPTVFVMHKIEFAFTRQVPCTDDSIKASCVEIVLRATLDDLALEAAIDKLRRREHLAPEEVPQIWSATYMRLVTDPDTLQSYSREMRRYSYWSSRKGGSDQSLIESEKTRLQNVSK